MSVIITHSAVSLQCPRCAVISDAEQWKLSIVNRSDSMGNYLRIVCPSCSYEAKARVEPHTFIRNPVCYVKEDF